MKNSNRTQRTIELYSETKHRQRTRASKVRRDQRVESFAKLLIRKKKEEKEEKSDGRESRPRGSLTRYAHDISVRARAGVSEGGGGDAAAPLPQEVKNKKRKRSTCARSPRSSSGRSAGALLLVESRPIDRRRHPRSSVAATLGERNADET